MTEYCINNTVITCRLSGWRMTARIPTTINTAATQTTAMPATAAVVAVW